MLITSCCGFSVFCMGVLYRLLSAFSGWLTARASHCSLHGCFYVVRNVGVRAVYWFFKVQLSALKIFSVISHFASLLLPIWETSREYFLFG